MHRHQIKLNLAALALLALMTPPLPAAGPVEKQTMRNEPPGLTAEPFPKCFFKNVADRSPTGDLDVVKAYALALANTRALQGHDSIHAEWRVFSGSYTAPPPPEGKTGMWGLAVFSDDGCTVVQGKLPTTVELPPGMLPPGPRLLEKAGSGQTLEKIDQSFHELPILLNPGETVDLTVKYSNTLYYKNPDDSADIDGVTMFVFFMPIDIVPDESMYDDPLNAGIAPPLFLSVATDITPLNVSNVRGDLIPSVIPNSPEKHFVTPQWTEEIYWDNVVLRANDFVGSGKDLITSGNPKQKFEWHFECKEDSQAGKVSDEDPTIFNVDRKKWKHAKVSIGPKGGTWATDTIKMHVWVVWTTCTPSGGVGEYYQADAQGQKVPPNGNSVKARWEVDTSATKTDATKLWKFTFKIEPKEIAIDPERPKLDGQSRKPVPGKGKIHTISPTTGDGDTAALKWDVSRQYKVTVRNPGSISKTDLLVSIPSEWAKNQPTAVDSPVGFPTDVVEGNDDSSSEYIDEDDNPYVANSTATLSHAEGELTSIDGPRLGVFNSWGATAQSYSCEINFVEFARLELWNGTRANGRFWFRISDETQGKWHHYLDATYDAAQSKWLNNQSSAKTGHPKP